MKWIFVLTLCAGSALAGDAEDGARIFGFHCAGCHGATAMGDGPTAALLTIAPADLTQLSAKAGGTFPGAYVADRIDGTVILSAHGGPMPVFGLLLEGAPEAISVEGGENIVPGAVADLIAWLETIQRP